MINALTCTATRRRLQAFHDDELLVADQIAVGAHLEWCDDCAEVFDQLQLLRSTIRTTARERASRVLHLTTSAEAARSFQQAVVSRVKAEQSASLAVSIRAMFDDMRLVYAGLGATVAAAACVLMMLNMMRFVKEDQRPNSLAAIVSALASAENQTHVSRPGPLVVDARLLLPSSSGARFAADTDDDWVPNGVDVEFGIAGVVTKEGRVANLELVRANGRPIHPQEAQALRKLMGAVAGGRYEPARVDGLPVAVNKVWLVAHTTVHASKDAPDRPVSIAAKKRITSLDESPARSAV